MGLIVWKPPPPPPESVTIGYSLPYSIGDVFHQKIIELRYHIYIASSQLQSSETNELMYKI